MNAIIEPPRANVKRDGVDLCEGSRYNGGMNPADKIRRHYRPRIVPGRANHDILDWAAAETQETRFDVLTHSVDLQDKSLLDVGCGLGDLCTFLLRKQIHVDYCGADIVEEMLQRAAELHPSRTFACVDVFSGPSEEVLVALGRKSDQPFDVVFCSGTLNLNLGNNMEFLPRSLRAMYELASETLVVNFLANKGYCSDPTYFNYSVHIVHKLARNLFPEATIDIRDDYLHNDFTLAIRREK